MKKTLLSALFAAALALPALPATAQSIEGILVEPRHPTTSDRIRLTVVEDGSCPLGLHEPVYEPATGSVVLHAEALSCPPPLPDPQPLHRTFEIGPLPAGPHFAEVRVAGFPGLDRREPFEVAPDTGQLGLQDDRFQVSVHWSNPHDGSSGAGHARQLTRDSGAFWFFSQGNLEVTVKILDGRAVNGHWWVFIASMTDLAAEIRIERNDGTFKTYVQAAGANRNFIDVDAFEEGPPPPAADLAPATPPMPRTFEVGGPDGQLRLQDTEESYFNVYVNLDGRPLHGVGYGVTLSPESGYFWFVDPDNIELTVKILDGRAVNGRWWVFIASMTDVGFTVEVERCASRFDPFGCGSQIYRSVPGVNRNFIDVNYP